jgi:hypothetical protein
MRLFLFTLLSFLFVSHWSMASELSDLVDDMGLVELSETFNEIKVTETLGGNGVSLSPTDRRSAVVLISMGVLESGDLKHKVIVSNKIELFRRSQAGKNQQLIGAFNDPLTQIRLQRIGDHESLLRETRFIDSLHGLLSKGIITGYDLRKINVSEGYDPSRTLTYSHSSIPHLKQLTALLASENIKGNIYAAPKVSAFLFREDWGEPPENVSSLADGRLVVNGREWVVIFEFLEPGGKHKFHQLITQYAKKDEEQERGLIIESWWQPFYYSEIEFDEFERINLILLSSASTEATLTVLPEKLESVKSALSEYPFNMIVEEVWVNKPFFRFLHGGFK